MTKHALSVLVIDDSAVVRRTVERRLTEKEGWSVTLASDGVIALERMRQDPPDVILLDLEMPRLDGLTFLKHIMATHPTPVVVCSSHAQPGSEAERAVLEAGAISILPKPELALKDFLEDSGTSLADMLRKAAQAGPALQGRASAKRTGLPSTSRPWEVGSDTNRPETRTPTDTSLDGGTSTGRVVLLGASMGGPDALRSILTRFPANGPACVVAQHMPPSHLPEFARRLDGVAAMEVRVAASGDSVVRGRVLIAPGGQHLVLESAGGGYAVRVTDEARVNGFRPSVDVLFESAARVLGANAVAAILTGMGRDGARGLMALRNAGARTLAQAREGCTVFGMPGAALELGAAERAVHIDHMARALLDLAGHGKADPTREDVMSSTNHQEAS